MYKLGMDRLAKGKEHQQHCVPNKRIHPSSETEYYRKKCY